MAEEADVLLLNTCSIREKAQEKVFHQLGRWKLLKEKNPDLIIGVGGCVASQEGEHIRQRAHYVDIIFGPQTLHRLPEMLGGIPVAESVVVSWIVMAVLVILASATVGLLSARMAKRRAV